MKLRLRTLAMVFYEGAFTLEVESGGGNPTRYLTFLAQKKLKELFLPHRFSISCGYDASFIKMKAA